MKQTKPHNSIRKVSCQSEQTRSKGIIWLIVAIICLSLIINLSKNIFRLVKISGQIKITQENVKQLQQKQAQLKAENQYYQSAEFIEEEARNKLNLVKPGETIALLPEKDKQITELPAEETYIPIWQRWLNLFYY